MVDGKQGRVGKMKAKAGFDTVLLSSDSERQAQDALLQLFRDTPVPDQEPERLLRRDEQRSVEMAVTS